MTSRDGAWVSNSQTPWCSVCGSRGKAGPPALGHSPPLSPQPCSHMRGFTSLCGCPKPQSSSIHTFLPALDSSTLVTVWVSNLPLKIGEAMQTHSRSRRVLRMQHVVSKRGCKLWMGMGAAGGWPEGQLLKHKVQAGASLPVSNKGSTNGASWALRPFLSVLAPGDGFMEAQTFLVRQHFTSFLSVQRILDKSLQNLFLSNVLFWYMELSKLSFYSMSLFIFSKEQ